MTCHVQQTQAINGRSIMFTIIDDKMMQKYKQLKSLMLSKTTWMASSDRPITDFPMWNSKKRFQQFKPLSTQWFIWKPKPDIMIHYRCRARLKRFKHFRNQANAKFMNVSLTVDIGINYPYCMDHTPVGDRGVKWGHLKDKLGFQLSKTHTEYFLLYHFYFNFQCSYHCF